MQIPAVCKVHKLPTSHFCLTFISPTYRSCGATLAIGNALCEASV
jgi:hypothetical protein